MSRPRSLRDRQHHGHVCGTCGAWVLHGGTQASCQVDVNPLVTLLCTLCGGTNVSARPRPAPHRPHKKPGQRKKPW
jgi:hypothetical protein